MVALRYLDEGRSVFPVCRPAGRPHRCIHHGNCTSPGKVPLVAWDRYQDQLPTREEVISWWTVWPDANIGMATGHVSGIDVLDGDSMDARSWATEQGIEPGAVVLTGKVGGTHWHFSTNGTAHKNFARRRPGLDFRGEGGYVLLPPSLHESGITYRWAPGTEALAPAPFPAWLEDLFTSRPATVEPMGGDGEFLDVGKLLTGIPLGERDSTLYRWASKWRGEGLSIGHARTLMIAAARLCQPPFDELIALEKVDRVYQSYEPNTTLEPTFEPAITTPLYEWQQIDELIEQREEWAPELVSGLLWANRVTWAFAAPGTGKTLFLTALGLHIASGRPFHGRAVETGCVCIIEEDSPLSVMAEYSDMLAAIYEINTKSIPLYINKAQGLRIVDEATLQAAKEAVLRCPIRPKVVLVDACERITPSDRYSSKELDPLIRFLQWCLSLGITPIVVDHTKKSQQQTPTTGPKLDPVDLLYGGRSKSGISDVMMYFVGSPTRGVHLEYVKFRGETPAGLDFSFSPDAGFALKEQLRKLSANQEKILHLLRTWDPGKYTKAYIVEKSRLPERTAERALSSLVHDRWLVREGETRQGVKFQLNPNLPSVFD